MIVPAVPRPIVASNAVSSAVGTWSCDLASERLTWCDGVRAIFGMPAGATPDRATTLQCYETASRLRLETARAAAIRDHRSFTLDARIDTVTGTPRWIRIIAATAGGRDGPARLHGVKLDITAERAGWVRARALADHDPLTGLAGRALFDEHLTAGSHAAAPGMALVLVALTPPAMADAAALGTLLRRSAIRLNMAFPAAGLVARTGPVRFAILIRRRIGEAVLGDILRRAAMMLRRPVGHGDGWLPCDLAIGAAIHAPGDRHDPAGLYARAERALATAGDGASPRIFGVPGDVAGDGLI